MDAASLHGSVAVGHTVFLIKGAIPGGEGAGTVISAPGYFGDRAAEVQFLEKRNVML